MQGKDIPIPTCQSSCADTSPKLEATMPEIEKNQEGCHTKKARDIFQPSFVKAKCELLRPGQCGLLRILSSRNKVEKPWIFRIEIE